MSVSCDVVIEGEDVSDPGFNGLYLLEDALTAVAVELGERPLLSFLAHPVQSRAEIVETGGLVAWGYPVVWHETTAGLRTVRALIGHLTTQRGASFIGDNEAILAALRALDSTLERIDGTGRRWHLAVSM